MISSRTTKYLLTLNILVLLLIAIQAAVTANYLKRDLERTQWVIVPQEKPAAPAAPPSDLRNV